MFKTFRWIYTLGVRHERRRIKLLIEQFRREKPSPPKTKESWSQDQYDRELVVYQEVKYVLENLMDPYPNYQQDVRVEIPLAPIDKES